MVRTHTTVLVRRAESQSRRCCKHSDVEVGDLAEATPELGGVPQLGVRRDDGVVGARRGGARRPRHLLTLTLTLTR